MVSDRVEKKVEDFLRRVKDAKLYLIGSGARIRKSSVNSALKSLERKGLIKIFKEKKSSGGRRKATLVKWVKK